MEDDDRRDGGGGGGGGGGERKDVDGEMNKKASVGERVKEEKKRKGKERLTGKCSSRRERKGYGP